MRRAWEFFKTARFAHAVILICLLMLANDIADLAASTTGSVTSVALVVASVACGATAGWLVASLASAARKGDQLRKQMESQRQMKAPPHFDELISRYEREYRQGTRTFGVVRPPSDPT